MVRSGIIKLDIRQYAFVKLLLFYVVGILVGTPLKSVFNDLLYLEVILILICLLYLLSFCFLRQYRLHPFYTFSLYALFLFFGYYQSLKGDPQFHDNYFIHHPAAQYVGIVADEPVEKEKTIRFPMTIQAAVDSHKSVLTQGKVMVTLLKDSLQTLTILYGDRVVIRNKISQVKPAYNPSQFDYQSYLSNKNIWYQALLKTADLKIINQDQGNPIISFSFSLRKRLVNKFTNYIEYDRSLQIASALIFGYRSAMDQEVISSFSKTGTIHVLSVSGLHVTIVFILLNFLLQWMDRFSNGRVVRFCIVLISIWGYVVLTGMAPPMLRAGVMISFYIMDQWMNRQQSPFNALAASAFFLLLINPQMLFDMGFQLSYLAMIGLSTFLVLFKEVYAPKQSVLLYTLNIMYVSLAAQLTTLPLVLYYFGQFPNYFLLANFFIAIPAMLMMYAGVFLALSPWDFLSQWLGYFLNQLIKLTYLGLAWISELPHANITGFYIDDFQLFLLILTIILLFWAWNYQFKKAFIGCLLFFTTFILYVQYQQVKYYKFDGIKFYNVNQHLAFARIANNQVLLFSTLDSLQHTTLQFNVLPDLQKYSNIDRIQFQHLSGNKRTNWSLQIDALSILILEGYAPKSGVPKADIILWRKNNRETVDDIIRHHPAPLVILDGSNGEEFIDKTTLLFKQKHISYYLLKNNYAYVWER